MGKNPSADSNRAHTPPSRSVDLAVVSRTVRGLGDPFEVLRDGLVPLPPREHKVPVIRLGRCPMRTLVDHQVTAVGFDHLLESLDGLFKCNEILGALIAGQRDAQPSKPGRDLLRRSFELARGCFGFALLWRSHCGPLDKAEE
jgi:hypothetical protein